MAELRSNKQNKYNKKEVRLKRERFCYDFTNNREGVFGHSFICNYCGLHFNIFSWIENRHTVANTYCPECGKRGSFRHHKIVLSESPEMILTSYQEIFNYAPILGSREMEDSKKPLKKQKVISGYER